MLNDTSDMHNWKNVTYESNLQKFIKSITQTVISPLHVIFLVKTHNWLVSEH